MSDMFLGEIRMMGFDFAPKGWAYCNGALMSLGQNTALFSLIGTQFGGDGRTTFALPDLRGTVPVHAGNGVVQGQRGGAEKVTLTVPELPSHDHAVNATAANAEVESPAGMIPAQGTIPAYHEPTNLAVMQQAVEPNGSGWAHENRQPSLAVNFCIALAGIYPSRS